MSDDKVADSSFDTVASYNDEAVSSDDDESALENCADVFKSDGLVSCVDEPF